MRLKTRMYICYYLNFARYKCVYFPMSSTSVKTNYYYLIGLSINIYYHLSWNCNKIILFYWRLLYEIVCCALSFSCLTCLYLRVWSSQNVVLHSDSKYNKIIYTIKHHTCLPINAYYLRRISLCYHQQYWWLYCWNAFIWHWYFETYYGANVFRKIQELVNLEKLIKSNK